MTFTSSTTTTLLILCALAPVSGRRARAEDWPRPLGALPTLSMRVQAVFLSDDDGGRKAAITPAQVKLWVDEANRIFDGAGIRLEFDPTPGSGYFREVQSSLVNSMSGVDHPDWVQQRAAANAIAAATPEDMVALFRWGPGAGPTGSGFSWTDYNFIAMPGFNNTFVCGVQNLGLFAHEAGHYLGLAHTFGPTFDTAAQAAAYFSANGGQPPLFDGDGRSDTPPDPFIAALQCDPQATSVTLRGTLFPLPRSNIMSYYEPRSEVASSQAWTMRQSLAVRAHVALEQTVPGASMTAIEAEATRPRVSGGFSTAQNMEGFLGKWSGDAQVLWLDAAVGQELRMSFQAPQSGLYRIFAGFTAAPDYGVHTHIINGQESDPLDFYAAGVIPTGAIDLGLFNLAAGTNQWRVRASGSNPLAAPNRHGYGLDYIVLAAVPEPAGWVLIVLAVAGGYYSRKSAASTGGTTAPAAP